MQCTIPNVFQNRTGEISVIDALSALNAGIDLNETEGDTPTFTFSVSGIVKTIEVD